VLRYTNKLPRNIFPKFTQSEREREREREIAFPVQIRVIKSKWLLVKITIYFKILAGYSTGIISVILEK